MRNNPYTKTFLKVFFISISIGVAALLIVGACALMGLFGGIDTFDIESLASGSSTQICYIDEDGNESVLTTLSASESRIWVDFDEIPQNLKDAMVAIEDERFYSHSGFDLKRTTKAFFVFVKNKLTGQPTTFGGSTITQQLVKNITKRTDRTAARKILEISSAVNLEKKISKDKILELYLNSIYLSQGCSGVQSASHKFFGKPVSELNLAECASIAGITQYPALYDPLINPDKNKEKQEIVLSKMLELGFIDQKEHDDAVAYKLEFTEFDRDEIVTGAINSYFVDHLIQQVTDDLEEKGYSNALANKMIYSGGLKIIATIDPKVQSAMEDVYEDTNNFKGHTGDKPIQSSMVVLDSKTGQIKGLVGGIGKKNGNLVLNRATQTLRQPGSTIKPIGVYAPAFEYGITNPAAIYPDKAISYGEWTPRNYDHKYGEDTSVRIALRRSLNTIPVQILNEMGADRSFNFLSQKLGITSLVRSQTDSKGKVYSDIGLSQLALGGMTHGISVLELTAAYTPFANRGIYSKPHCYTAVYDSKGDEILSSPAKSSIALSEKTAFITSMLLKEVVTSGTGGGAQLASGMFTAGKTGTTSDNNDRWFVGYTPHYVGAVWYGYDEPRPISVSGNPCIGIWRNVMTPINAGKSLAGPPAPSGVKYASYCTKTGNLPGEHCGEEVSSCWFIADNMPKEVCTSSHKTEEELKAKEELENAQGQIQDDTTTDPETLEIPAEPSDTQVTEEVQDSTSIQ